MNARAISRFVTYHFKMFTKGRRYRRYIRTLAKTNPEYTIVIFNGIGIGDICLNSAYLQAFREENNIKILLVVAENVRWVTECFSGYDKLICVSKYKLDDFRYIMSKHIRWRWYDRNFLNKKIIFTNIRYHRALSPYPHATALESLRNIIYRLEKYVDIQYPSLPNNEDNVVALENGKKILLNAVSNSSKIPIEIFDPIIKYFRNNGYIVYMNCAYPDDYYIDGTQQLVTSSDELYAIGQEFDFIVSIRSGILDFLASKGKRQIVLYDHNDFMELFTMKQWPGVNALEMYYDDPNLMEKIKVYVEETNED